jgi:molybdate-binding protein/DNA-binding transcriptional regulator YhcF (GntR family)
MEETFLYHQIAESIRTAILEGKLHPGDRLPSVRELMHQWNCTPGTIQRAYQELSRQGLVVSRAGKGTHVAGVLPPMPSQTPLRRAVMVNRAEAFLLESFAAGYSLEEIRQSFDQALDRWRAVDSAGETGESKEGGWLHFFGSHDLAVAWLSAHFDEIALGSRLDASFTGSLGGLMALAEGKADLAGCHLWDDESDSYNLPFVRRLLPGRHVRIVTLAHRRLGLILPPGNPLGLRKLADLLMPGVVFVNRQSGSGTRVWLDANLTKMNIHAEQIPGYGEERLTHSDVARAVAENKANVGLGLEQSALAFGLDFISLARERYDLVIPEFQFERPEMCALVAWLQSPAAQAAFVNLKGYDTAETGKIVEIG